MVLLICPCALESILSPPPPRPAFSSIFFVIGTPATSPLRSRIYFWNTTMAPTNQAAWITEKGGKPLVVKSAPYPSPEANQIVIKNAAVAINPMDWMLQLVGFLAFSWLKYPNIFGADMAGEVVEVGSGVKRFAVGDRVLALGVGGDPDTNSSAQSTFQNYTIARDNLASQIPDDMSFDKAVVLPLGLATAASGLFQEDFLNLQWPTIPPQKSTGKTLLVWGGSTSVGSNAVQLAAAAGYEVFSTSSPRNFEYVKKLGASYVFDYNSKTIAKDLVTALKGKQMAGALAVGPNSLPFCIDILSKTEGVKFVTEIGGLTLPPDRDVTGLTLVSLILGTLWTNISLRFKRAMTGVQSKFVWGSDLKKTDLGKAIFENFLPKALAEHKYIAAPEPQIVGHGLEYIQDAMNQQRKGVSAKKLVVTL
ncbi:zinc-binding oxidoreductase CipB [Talaromyces proteolyticus]|uniref:Zinc-binding oxidoreductase CipB n=1 Tax=Talaromyces proteolyticus TaxID=1131652 RepID=A0AAD4KH62_9EURO|nr:zinc-binding oxidoreductase CipB [Talaromyces proteolyticus]KAH8690262.1 zinc-binding oxidoreductase CipB [Talaromyces proteolyticus]